MLGGQVLLVWGVADIYKLDLRIELNLAHHWHFNFFLLLHGVCLFIIVLKSLGNEKRETISSVIPGVGWDR